MYQILPETEDRSLEDIELHFSDNSKKLTDRKIAKLNISNGKISGIGPTEKKKIEAGFDNKAFVSECSKMWSRSHIDLSSIDFEIFKMLNWVTY